MQEILQAYLFIWGLQFIGMLFWSILEYENLLFLKAKTLAIYGLIGPIPSIILYYYKLFK